MGQLADIHALDSMILNYCHALIVILKSCHSQVVTALPRDSTPLVPGDWVLVKVFQWKHYLIPRWKGPFQILLTTNMAVKCQGLPSWVYTSHCNKLCPTGRQVLCPWHSPLALRSLGCPPFLLRGIGLHLLHP
uniref:Murine leukemia virus integrase C-terminal domain-containing protein n=1 Tax=Naja naja TaxID=35670 RepID=A0A8C6Y9I0_NAJNA